MTKSERSAIVDEFGELARQLAQAKPLRDRYDRLSKEIQSWYEDKPADESFVAEGSRYTVQVSARQTERTVHNKPWLCNWMGLERFLDHATIGLRSIDSLVPKVWHGEFITEAQTGRRSLTPVAARAAAPQKKIAA